MRDKKILAGKRGVKGNLGVYLLSVYLGRITGYSNLEKDKSDMNSSRKQWHG
jgi:hypothetical protein